MLRYWFFRLRIEEDRILIRQGVLRKTSLDLPLDRVQGINIERSLTDRVLGLVTVMVDTAGSGDQSLADEGSAGADPATQRRDDIESAGEVIVKLPAAGLGPSVWIGFGLRLRRPRRMLRRSLCRIRAEPGSASSAQFAIRWSLRKSGVCPWCKRSSRVRLLIWQDWSRATF